MFKHLQPSALAVGAFCGQVIPFLLTLLFANRIYDTASTQDTETARFYYWLMVATNVLGPVVGGFFAARLSLYQPLLHGLLAGLLGGVVVSAFRGFNGSLLLYYAFAGVAGGWLAFRIKKRAP